MSIWAKEVELSELTSMASNIERHLGIEFIEIGKDFLRAKMPVNTRAHQPLGRLHGGISCVLIETMGSIGAYLTIKEGKFAVGTDINASHLRGAYDGHIIGLAKPLKLGGRMQFWSVEITGDDGLAICSGRLTVAVIDQ